MPLTDAQWARVAPVLSERPPVRRGARGERPLDDRDVLDAIAWKFQTGLPWGRLPEKYGHWRGVYDRLRTWALDGTWERVFIVLLGQADVDDDVVWMDEADATVVRVRQVAARAREAAGTGRQAAADRQSGTEDNSGALRPVPPTAQQTGHTAD
ncbi:MULTISPECIES: transposase [Streptomyces]|uniref:transposase n=1 Tax=Streptomyces TaxID=1883 RepID=UPI0007C71CB9|nr:MULTISPECIES: transposase [Streptomyces]